MNIKSILCIASALFCGVLNAGAMGNNCKLSPGNQVTVDCPNNYWDLGISGLYLKLSSGITTPYVQVSESQYGAKNIWTGGFLLEASRHFNTGNDFTVEWEHFNEHHEQYVRYVGRDPRRINDGSFGQGNDYAFKTSLDSVNFEFAQKTNVGMKDKLRLYSGLQYLHVTGTNNQANYEQREPNTGRVDLIAPYRNMFDATTNSHFNGFGPRIGGQANHEFNKGFSVFAHGAVALLVGNKNVRLSGTNRSVPTYVETSFAGYTSAPLYHYQSVTAVVPEFEYKIGLEYNHLISSGHVQVMAGWMAQYYQDVLLSERVEYPSTPGNSAPNYSVSTATLATTGPFVKAKWYGDAA